MNCDTFFGSTVAIFPPELFILFLLFAKGDEDSNQFGPVRTTATWEKVIAWIYIIIIPITIIFTIITLAPIAPRFNEIQQALEEIPVSEVASSEPVE